MFIFYMVLHTKNHKQYKNICKSNHTQKINSFNMNKIEICDGFQSRLKQFIKKILILLKINNQINKICI